MCGQRGYAEDFAEILPGLRETGRCSHCGATNRHRQIGLVLAGSLGDLTKPRPRSVRDITRSLLRVHNTETTGPIHRELTSMSSYTASEYFSSARRSGDTVDGVMHQDLMALSFPANSVDVLISSDVLEHVADPYLAHREIYRVPPRRLPRVHRSVPRDPIPRRATSRGGRIGRGDPLAEPVYHADPINPDPGALVFTYFSLEMLVRLKQIGFDTNMYWLHKPTAGISVRKHVFAAVKPSTDM